MNKYLIVYHTVFSDTLYNKVVSWDKISNKNILDFELQEKHCHKTIVNIIKLDS